jgi:hypothetical protein
VRRELRDVVPRQNVPNCSRVSEFQRGGSVVVADCDMRGRGGGGRRRRRRRKEEEQKRPMSSLFLSGDMQRGQGERRGAEAKTRKLKRDYNSRH